MTRTMYMEITHTFTDANGGWHADVGDPIEVHEPFTQEQEWAWADLTRRNSAEGWDGETPEIEFMTARPHGKRIYRSYTLA